MIAPKHRESLLSRRIMKKHLIIALGLIASAATFAQSLPQGTGYITYTLSQGVYTYDIHLTNTGSTTIGTLWYAWNPGQNYLPTMPTNVMGPTGWNASVTHGGSTDGYGIRFLAQTSGDYLSPNDSESGFMFSTTDSPTVLDGQSVTYSGANIGDSFLYHAGAFSDSGTQITLQTVPEPSDFLLAVPLMGLLIGRRKKRSR